MTELASPPQLIGDRAGLPFADALQKVARWLLGAALILTMTTPRLALGGVHFSAGDILGGLAGAAWLLAWLSSPSRRMTLAGGLWPVVIVAIAAVSAVTSVDIRAAGVGLIELSLLWVLPSLVIPNLASTDASVTSLLTCISIGSVIAGCANLLEAVTLGAAGGLPQVWGAAQYLQGYLQAIGLIIAISRLLTSAGSRHPGSALLWSLACFVNASALILTQTRGAWLAALIGMLVVGILRRPSLLIGAGAVLAIVVAVFWGADWAVGIQQRVQSTFSLDAGVSGFESSVGRLALIWTAWRVFLAHPLLGVGLKNFAHVMPMYAPPGMPLAYEMGPGHVYTPVEGPHSTYMSLLSEVGLFGALGLVCWEIAVARRFFKESTGAGPADRRHQANSTILLAAATIVIVFNFFFEMNQAGSLVFVSMLALAYRSRAGQSSGVSAT